jgi:hypothetical protein
LTRLRPCIIASELIEHAVNLHSLQQANIMHIAEVGMLDIPQFIPLRRFETLHKTFRPS